MTTSPLSLGGITNPAEAGAALNAAVKRGFANETESRRREPHHLGISSLGGCTRRAAYTVAKTPPSDQIEAEEGRAANLGTWEHNGLLPRIAENLRDAQTEVDVVLHAAGLEIPGHIDLHTPDMVLDLKTVGEWRLQAVRQSGPFPEHLLQVAAYAVAKLQAGQPPRWLVILYMDRASGDEEEFVVPFSNEHLLLVVDRVARIREWAEEDPDSAPRRNAAGTALSGPGYSFACNDCPWLRQCWGPDAQPGQRPRYEYNNEEIEELLQEYVEMNAVEGPAKRRKAEIAAMLETVRHGTYGDVKFHRSPDTVIDDPYAALKTMKALGYEVPMKAKRGTLSVRRVTATKKSRSKRTAK